MVDANNVYANKAEEFMQLGDKKIRGHFFSLMLYIILILKWILGGFFDKMFGNKGERAEEACELYKQAATNFKLAKQCKEFFIFLKKTCFIF